MTTLQTSLSSSKRSRSSVLAGLLIAVLLVALVAWQFDWLSGEQPWERATGWNRIPADQRAPLATQLGERGPEIAWLGHAGFRLRWAGATILLDPNTSSHVTVARRALEQPAALGAVDGVAISHAHFDHMNESTLRGIDARVPILVPAGSEAYLPDRTTIPLRLHESTRIGAVEVIAVPAAHNGSRFHPWKSEKMAVGYILKANGYTVYFAGDTSFANDFVGIRDRYRPDAAILPIGCFAPRFPFKIHHVSPEEAVAAAKILGVSVVVPCHFGTYRLTGDRPATALPRFARAAAESGVSWLMPVLWGQQP